MIAFIKHTKPADAHQAKQLIILADKNGCLCASSPLLCQLHFIRVRSVTHFLKPINMQGQGRGSWTEVWLKLHSRFVHPGLRNVFS